jgi:regulatory protein YycI of two-component signal transduction system YycFG
MPDRKIYPQFTHSQFFKTKIAKPQNCNKNQNDKNCKLQKIAIKTKILKNDPQLAIFSRNKKEITKTDRPR